MLPSLFKQLYKEAKDFLDRQTDKVKSNLEIQIVSDTNPYTLHISDNPNIPKFEPVIGHRQADTEDRTVPRVCVADTLVGCMIACNTLSSDFFNWQANGNKERLKGGHYRRYKGGYYIYAIPYQASFVPSKDLVYDAPITGEKWLVNYKENTSSYQGRVIGKFFIKELTTTIVDKQLVKRCKLYLTVKEPLYLTQDEYLEPGSYLLEGPVPESISSYKKKSYQVFPIDKKQFEEQRRISVSLLSLEEPKLKKW